MSTSQGEAATTEEHAAPPEAWDAIAEGYDRYVAPRRPTSPTRRSALPGSGPASGSSTSRQGPAVSACRPPAWEHTCSRPTGRPR